MNAEQVLSALVTRSVATNPFEIARGLCQIVAEPDDRELAHECVLRALDQRDAFGPAAKIIDGLLRELGLYPYLEPRTLGLADRIAYEVHRPDGMAPNFVFHKAQAEVFRYLMAGENVVLSAPTSFGKSQLIDAVIANRNFKNICVIVPSVALIDETRRRLQKTFASRYKVITQPSQTAGPANIFVLTQERAVERTDLGAVEFFVIDEFYKLDIDDDNPERGITLNQAFYNLLQNGAQFYLLGPNVQHISEEFREAYPCRFVETSYTTVVSEVHKVEHDGTEESRTTALMTLIDQLSEPTLIYCRSPQRLGRLLPRILERVNPSNRGLSREAVEWFSRNYDADWHFLQALRRGVGIHHGRIPRALSQYVVRLFNEEKIPALICTSSLIEGVNTKAKNVIVYDGTLNMRKLDFFTFQNISGRAGRLGRHLVGHVWIFDPAPEESEKSVGMPFVTQGEHTPTPLLFGMQPSDLKEPARARIEVLLSRGILSRQTLASNSPIDPELQFRLAEYLEANIDALAPRLGWSGNPQYADLKLVCELIWKQLARRPERIGGARTFGQLTWRIFQLWKHKSDIAAIVEDERDDPKYPRMPDEIVALYLDVQKSWLQHRFPRLLMTLNNVQREVLLRAGRVPGDYTAFVVQAEHLFSHPVYVALDEYGLPMQIAKKLHRYIIRGNDNDIDVVLGRLKRLDPSRLGLSSFERKFVLYTRNSAPDSLFHSLK